MKHLPAYRVRMTEEEACADCERLTAWLQAKIDAWGGDVRDSWVRDRWVHNRDAIRAMAATAAG
jgi:hypothetical protein